MFFFFANQALGQCLSPKSFITITLLQIDLQEQSLEIARAGHCPTCIMYRPKTTFGCSPGP
ncbi:MAG: SpoIIE family protein phosphatase, partial [Microscillaceae bacterium]|nr:SpoIIE family protein phosphatase [Microscillaceae bacterium]